MVKGPSDSVYKKELFIVSESPPHGAHIYLGHISVSLQKKKVNNFKTYLKTTFYQYFPTFSRPLLTTYFLLFTSFYRIMRAELIVYKSIFNQS